MTMTPAQVKAQQKQQAERETAARKAGLKDPPQTAGNGQLALPSVPAVTTGTALAVPNTRQPTSTTSRRHQSSAA